MKLTTSIALCVSFAILTSVLFGGICSASVLNVTGELEDPANYSSIRDALNNSREGDTVLVYRGVYSENLNISTENLTLKAPPGEKVFIVAQDPGSPAISICADDITITGFSINVTGIRGTAVFLEDGNGLKLINNSIDTFYRGISLENGKNCWLENNSISGGDSGIFLRGACNNTFIGNTIEDCSEGFLCKDRCTGNFLLENRLLDNFRAVYLEYFCSKNRLKSNVLLNNSFGICLEDNCCDNALENNTIVDGKYGVYLDNSCNQNILYFNNASQNRYAFYLKASCRNNFLNSNKINDSLYGFYMEYSCSGNTLAGNSISSVSTPSGIRGIFLGTTCDNNTLEENLIEGQAFEGIRLENSSDNLLVGNNVSKNSEGIELDNSCVNNTLQNNTLFKNSLFGIVLEKSKGNRISNNSILNNSEGLHLGFSSYNFLTGNTVTFNGRGISFVSSEKNFLDGNRVSFNRKGIFFFASDENVLNNSYVLQNSLSGLSLEDSENNTVYNNFFDNLQNAADTCKNNSWNIPVSSGLNIYNGPQIGGNYWSDYSGKDLNLDGFGDEPYVSGNITDYLPLVKDITPPVISLNSPETMVYRMLPIPVSAEANEAISEWQYTVSGSEYFGGSEASGPKKFTYSSINTAKTNLYVSNGTYTLLVSGTDLSGNLNSTTVDFRVDLDPSPSEEDSPLICIDSPEEKFYSSSGIELDVSANRTILYWEYALDGGEYCEFEESSEKRASSVLNVSDGKHEVVVFGINDRGYSNFTSRSFMVDTIPPVLTVRNPLNSSTVSNSSVMLLVDSSESVSGWTCTLDGSETLHFNETYGLRAETTLLNIPEGPHTITVSAADFAGNCNLTTVYFRVNGSGDFLPEISIVSPADDNLYNTSHIEFRVISNEGISTWHYTLDNSTFRDFGEWNDFAAFSALELEDGKHCLKAYGRDFGNNTNLASVYFSVDTQAPLITVNSPLNRTQYTTPNSEVNQSLVNLNVTINEQGSIWYRVDNALPSDPVNGMEMKSSFYLDAGPHNITFFAKDLVGNLNSTSSYIEVYVNPCSGSEDTFRPSDDGLPAYYKLKLLKEMARNFVDEQVEPLDEGKEIPQVAKNFTWNGTKEENSEDEGFFSWLEPKIGFFLLLLLGIFFSRFIYYILRDIDR